MTDWTTKTRAECETWLDAQKLVYSTGRKPGDRVVIHVDSIEDGYYYCIGDMIALDELTALRMACAAAEVRVGK